MISIPIQSLKVGPFEVTRSYVADGWTRYSLVVEGAVIRTWMSAPSINDCRDAVMLHQAKHGPTRRTVHLLLRSADPAAEEAEQISERSDPGSRCRFHP